MLLDPRGVRFGAALTSIVLLLVLITGSGPLALAQAAVFAVTAAWPRRGPYALLYRALVAPRLGFPPELEHPAPVRFSQLLGLALTVVAAVGYLSGLTVLGLVAAAATLVASFLLAAFGLCMGCELYLAVRRLAGRPLTARVPADPGSA